MINEEFNDSIKYINKFINYELDIGLILGSGLGVMAEDIKNSIIVEYEKIPHFPVSGVEGHAGRLIFGELDGKNVVAMQGRSHYYEGYSMQELVYPVRIMKLLGISKLLITNAAGGINHSFKAGQFMIISDHINLMGENPLRGDNIVELGPRFPDMTEAYNKKLIAIAEKAALQEGIKCNKGVYAALSGPSYETPAEIRFLERIGADTVGMSTVPEVIVARHMGVEVLGISCITNLAAGILSKPLNHEEVIKISKKVKPQFKRLIHGILKLL